MRLLMHDYGAYPFPVQLSRELARRGHQVMHAFCNSLWTTPGGDYERNPGDSENLEFCPIVLKEPLNKASLVKRWKQENEYGGLSVDVARQFGPEMVVSANTPLDAQAKLHRYCRQRSVPFIFWLQDVIGVATHSLLSKKIPVAGHLVGSYYMRLESRLLRQSDHCLNITDAFAPLLRDRGVPDERMTTLENWAPIEELPIGAKDNAWSREMGLHDKECVIYTGTLGLKHNPDTLLALAKKLRGRPNARLVLVSEGKGAEWLKVEAERNKLDNLVVTGYAPFEQVPMIMATADVLVALLEPEAGLFSVPSKVLAYLCAKRPIVLSVPPNNLAASIVREHQAGLVADPEDVDGFVNAVLGLLADPEQGVGMAFAGRDYAERTFQIEGIADRFESIIEPLLQTS